MTDKQIRRFKYVSEQLSKCGDPCDYVTTFDYKVVDKTKVDEREIRRITKGRYLTYKVIRCNKYGKKIIMKGKTLGGIGLTVSSAGFKKFKISRLFHLIEKWSKNAYNIDKKNDLRFQRKMDPFGIESHQITNKNMSKKNKNSKSKSSTLEKESKKFSRYLEFSKCTVPDKYAEMFGYEVEMLSSVSPKIKHRRVLTYKIDPAGDLFKISIKGRTLGGEMIQVSTKPFDVFREINLKNAVSKWSGCAYRVDSKIFGNPTKVN